MHRYGSFTRCLLVAAVASAATACSLPSPRENAAAAAQLVRAQSRAALEWRRNPAEDRAARERAAALLADGVTIEDAVAVAFLASPALQVQLEQLAISRAELVAAMTPPNPVAIVGSRKPGGELAVFYPERSVSIGVLQNVMALLTMPDRVAIARRDLERARSETARQAVTYAAQVVQAWLEYSAAVQIHRLNERNLAAARGASASSAVTVALDQLLRSELAAATTRAKLGELMGTTGWREDWEVAAVLPPVPATDPDPDAVKALALRQRLDLRVAAQNVEVRLRALAMHRRFRWLNTLEFGMFREKALGGTAFTGPNAVVELPLFDQRFALLLQSDAELAIAVRKLEAAQIAALTDITIKVAELRAIRQQLQQQFGTGTPAPADEIPYAGMQREYWRARSALALAAGDWAALSGL